ERPGRLVPAGRGVDPGTLRLAACPRGLAACPSRAPCPAAPLRPAVPPVWNAASGPVSHPAAGAGGAADPGGDGAPGSAGPAPSGPGTRGRTPAPRRAVRASRPAGGIRRYPELARVGTRTRGDGVYQ